ncbi:MAG: hypothetical protein ACRDHP_02350 [Ktedonobacterales bacterium]
MPTYEVEPLFAHQFARRSRERQERFRAAVKKLVEDRRTGRMFRKSLRVTSWEYHDGRALFRYGDEIPDKPGPHIIWERIGGHDMFSE